MIVETLPHVLMKRQLNMNLPKEIQDQVNELVEEQRKIDNKIIALIKPYWEPTGKSKNCDPTCDHCGYLCSRCGRP